VPILLRIKHSKKKKKKKREGQQEAIAEGTVAGVIGSTRGLETE